MAKIQLSMKELRDLPEAELKEKMATLRQELWQNRLRARQGSFQQTHQLTAARHNVARIQTVMTERRKAQQGKGAK